MRRVRMLRTSASPAGSFDQGREYALGDALAEALVACDGAVYLDGTPAESSPEPEVEEAVAEPEAEVAEAPPKRRRTRKKKTPPPDDEG